jgi:hypothetical protein
MVYVLQDLKKKFLIIGSFTLPLLCVQWKTPDDGQRNCPKHVEFHSKNTFEKLVHLVGFIIKKFITMHGHMNVKLVNNLLTAWGNISLSRKTLLVGV